MRTKILMLILFVIVGLGLQAQEQCPFGRTDCYGECGRFTDSDADGFCDIGNPPKKAEPKKVDAKKQDVEKAGKDNKLELNKDNNKKENNTTTATKADAVSGATKSYSESETTVDTETSTVTQTAEIKKGGKKPYGLITITLIVLGCYSITAFLVKRGVIRKFTHRKIWNFVLLVTFLVSCLLGMFLIIQIDYGVSKSTQLLNLKLHVQFGIAMTVVSIIHILWHLPYFKKMFTPKTSKTE